MVSSSATLSFFILGPTHRQQEEGKKTERQKAILFIHANKQSRPSFPGKQADHTYRWLFAA
jgi:hypothetical protein